MALKYKVGDRVKIQSLERYNKYKNRYGDINYGCETEILFTSEMSSFCGQVVTITRVRYIGCVRFYHLAEDKGVHLWVAGMFEGLAEEGTNKLGTALNPIEPKSNANCLTMERVDETKPEPKFKVGDKVKWYNHTCNIKSIDTDENTYTYLIKHNDYREDKAFTKWVPENELTFEDDEETKPIDFTIKATDTKGKVEVVIPEGYGYVVENDKLYFITKKKEYPKTYEECCKVLDIDTYDLVLSIDYRSNKMKHNDWKRLGKLNVLNQILICRDAYWKIAGEKMGLGKPWEPQDTNTFSIFYDRLTGEIQKQDGYCGANSTLEFPTAEMRDDFKKNFDPDIEICKELL